MGNIKEINIKNRIYYYLDDVTKIKKFVSNILKIDKKSHKNIYIYYIGYITIRDISDYESIHGVIPLYLIIGEVDDTLRKKWKYLVFASRDKNKEVLEKYTEPWDGIKSQNVKSMELNFKKTTNITQIFLHECLYEL